MWKLSQREPGKCGNVKVWKCENGLKENLGNVEM